MVKLKNSSVEKIAINVFILISVLACKNLNSDKVKVTGELKKWHTISLTFTGPEADELGRNNPFLNYRMSVTFEHDKKSYTVPGFFAADGNASETSSSMGNKWMVRFKPDQEGDWKYTVSFREGEKIALSTNPDAGSPITFDGETGTFTIGTSDKSCPDNRAKGMLRYVGKHYLQFAETSEYYIKRGTDAPENFLAYHEFDDTYDIKGNPLIHTFQKHIKHWQQDDPTWKGDKGKGIIGALNYLSEKKVNSVYFIPYTIDGGDGGDTWPWVDENSRMRFDCSKLDQWEIVFSHMDKLGIQLHFVLSEVENFRALSGFSLTDMRKLYYREMVARFAHHLALQWNIGEENIDYKNANSQNWIDFAQFIRSLDTYNHPITIHTKPNQADKAYDYLFGNLYYESSSIQQNPTYDGGMAVNKVIQYIRKQSAEKDKKWAVYYDEQIGYFIKDDLSNLNDHRNSSLYGTLFGGGAGVEWTIITRRTTEEFETFSTLWEQTGYAVDFMQEHLPFTEMEPRNDLIIGGNGYCFTKEGEVYAIYFPSVLSTRIDFKNHTSKYSVKWFDPRNGGELQNGTFTIVQGAGKIWIGKPPKDSDKDWVALLKRVE